MKRIRGLSAPTPGLADYLETETRVPSWDGFRSYRAGASYRELVGELTDLQRGLCGYCEIELTGLERQVEHVVPQGDPTEGAARTLDASNLIACCQGGTRKGSDPDRYLTPVKRNRSCGEAKGDRRNGAFMDPRNLPERPSLVRVLDNGRIEADAAACESENVPASNVARTIDVLNLNAERLRLAREKRWRALNEAWQPLFDDPSRMKAAARGELLPTNGRLSAFFTTTRSYFGPLAERVLAERPETWI